MSEAVQNNDTPSWCDRLLDYAYGELSGDELDQFKLHLLGCEKCKRELAGLERVRSAVKQALPQVEPPVDKMAQLMLAAAQQKPKRGKVLMFARRVASHPAYAAAAVFVLVATTVTINWSKHSLQMPAETPVVHEATQEPVETHEAVAAPAPAVAPAETTLALEKQGAKDKNKESGIVLKTQPGTFTVHKAPAAKKGGESDGLLLQPTLDGAGSGGGMAAGDFKRDDGVSRRHGTAGALGKAGPQGKAEMAEYDDATPADRPQAKPQTVAKPAPPPPPPKAAERSYRAAEPEKVAMESGRMTNEGRTSAPESPVIANQAPGRESSMAPQNQVATGADPAPAQVAPPPAHAAPAAPAPTAALADELRQKGYDSNGRQQQKSVDPIQLKKQFLELAKSDRCAEAIDVHKQIEKRFSGLLTQVEELEYTRCVRRSDLEQKALATETKASAPRASKKSSKAKKSPAANSDAILAPVMK